MPYDKFSVGVLFENSIVCHVFYAMALGAAHVCVWFLGFVLFWFAWSSFRFVVGVGLGCGLVFWAVVLTLGSGWPLFVVGWGLICWFCLESLILAQDERWRRA